MGVSRRQEIILLEFVSVTTQRAGADTGGVSVPKGTGSYKTTLPFVTVLF
jgi:hypothetical protein